jgi:uncharacterized protein involved in response to NO
MLILLIGGRVTPSFTANWLAKAGVSQRPVPFGRADGVVMTLSGLAVALWVDAPAGALTGMLALAAGAANLASSPRARTRSRHRGFPTPRACMSGRLARSA